MIDVLEVRTAFGGSLLDGFLLQGVTDAVALDEKLLFFSRRCVSIWLQSENNNYLISLFLNISSKLSFEDAVVFRGNIAVTPEKLRCKVLNSRM